MPKTKSAQKALRQNTRRKARNLSRKAALKSAIKGFAILIKNKKTEEAAKALPGVYKTVDKMRKVQLIKRGKASRIKSRLAKKLNTHKTGV